MSMIKVLQDTHTCSRCGKVFIWRTIFNKPKYYFLIDRDIVNCKYSEQTSDKYVIYTNCPSCGHSDIVERPVEE